MMLKTGNDYKAELNQTKWLTELGMSLGVRRNGTSFLTSLCAVCALSGIILLVPWEAEGLTEWRTRYRPWIFVLVVISCTYLMVRLGRMLCYNVIKCVSSWRDRSTQKRHDQAYQQKIIRRLYSLSDEEMCLIAYLIYKNQQTITVPFPNEVTHCLEHKQIMFQARGIGARDAWPYTVNDFVWEHICAHQKDFLRHFDLNDANARRTLERFGERMQSQRAMEEYRSDKLA